MVPKVDTKPANEVMSYLVNEFGKTDDMRKTHTMRRLRNHIFRDNETLDGFFKTFRELRKEAMDAGNDVPDDIFRELILAAFPTVMFDTIMQNIMANPTTFATSSAVIQHITYQHSRSSNRPDAAVSGGNLPHANLIAALQNRIEHLERQGSTTRHPEKKCSNLNCLRSGHLAEECFRKGGGKEGQYPAWWRGKKDAEKPITPSPSANVTSTVGEPTQYYAALSVTNEKMEGETYADSGATDHFFRNRSDFIIYTPCSRISRSSEISTTLEIVGYGRAKKTYATTDLQW